MEGSQGYFICVGKFWNEKLIIGPDLPGTLILLAQIIETMTTTTKKNTQKTHFVNQDSQHFPFYVFYNTVSLAESFVSCSLLQDESLADALSHC